MINTLYRSPHGVIHFVVEGGENEIPITLCSHGIRSGLYNSWMRINILDFFIQDNSVDAVKERLSKAHSHQLCERCFGS